MTIETVSTNTKQNEAEIPKLSFLQRLANVHNKRGDIESRGACIEQDKFIKSSTLKEAIPVVGQGS